MEAAFDLDLEHVVVLDRWALDGRFGSVRARADGDRLKESTTSTLVEQVGDRDLGAGRTAPRGAPITLVALAAISPALRS